MSGGFFRGTSADQDTRFSNKQAKLMKSQKFPPELDHLVDMTKVKMDVIRPWIAKRATELLGFEDEVLINFVYGLLDKKEVDGKEIQIQLTGFMEKNTGKFMKELWGLLLSAQNNVSGVPQQFLDAKEEETRIKKMETDRIAQEIQKRRDRDGGEPERERKSRDGGEPERERKSRDGGEPERERKSRFDGEVDNSKFTKAASDSGSKFSKPRDSSIQPDEDVEADVKHGSRAKNGYSRSPPPNDRSPSPSRVASSPTRSKSKSISRSRSYSQGRQKSRSLSVSSHSQRRSISPVRHYQSPERRSQSPKRRYRSPPRRSISPRRRRSPRSMRSPLRRRSPHLRRRSPLRRRSRSPYRFRSPARRRSPRRRSPSPYRRRSPPLRRPSPYRRRSPSPSRRRSPSPYRRRSPSPSRRRSPIKARKRSPSPVQRRPPIRQRSVSLERDWSASPLRRQSPPPRSPKYRQRSPMQSSKRQTSESPLSPQERKRSPSPLRSQSPPRRTRRSLSRERISHANGSESRRYRNEQTSQRADTNKSPAIHTSERDLAERTGSKQKSSGSSMHKALISLRSPQRDRCDVENHSRAHKKMPFSRENSLSNSESPTDLQKVNSGSIRRSRSFSKSPIRQTSGQKPCPDSRLGTSDEEQHMTPTRRISSHQRSNDLLRDMSPESSVRREFNQSPAISGRALHSEAKREDTRQESDLSLPERHARQLPNTPEEIEYAPGRAREEKGSRDHNRQQSDKMPNRDVSFDKMERNKQLVDDERSHQQGVDGRDELHHKTESIAKSKRKMDKKSRLDVKDSDSEDSDLYRNKNIEKQRHKKSDKRKRDYVVTSGSDPQIEDKKEAKRRRKDEKRQRKEEKRRRREERHLRKLERRAAKLKTKSIDTVSPPSDMDQGDAGDSDGGGGARKGSYHNEELETESEQKKLEIELREKALESLRAKKAFSH